MKTEPVKELQVQFWIMKIKTNELNYENDN
jgi:hypothetical protein